MIDLLNMVIFQSAMFNNQGAILLHISLNHCCTPFKSFNGMNMTNLDIRRKFRSETSDNMDS